MLAVLYSFWINPFLVKKGHGLWRWSYLDIVPGYGASFIFHCLMNVRIIFLSPGRKQKLYRHRWSGEMFLEFFLVVWGKPRHVFTVKSPNESCSLILTPPAQGPLCFSSFGWCWCVAQSAGLLPAKLHQLKQKDYLCCGSAVYPQTVSSIPG